jgi:hypothetical protein
LAAIQLLQMEPNAVAIMQMIEMNVSRAMGVKE